MIPSSRRTIALRTSIGGSRVSMSVENFPKRPNCTLITVRNELRQKFYIDKDVSIRALLKALTETLGVCNKLAITLSSQLISGP